MASIPEYPELVLSMKQFSAGFCKCTTKRKGTECDCQLCSYISYNMTKPYRARLMWHRDEPTCSDTCICKEKRYSLSFKSPNAMMDSLLCGFLPDENVNGPLHEPLEAPLEGPREPAEEAPLEGPEEAAAQTGAEEEAARAARAQADKARWGTDSPRWLTQATAKKPFQCYSNECLNGIYREKKRGAFGPLSTPNAGRGCGWEKKFSRKCPVEYSE